MSVVDTPRRPALPPVPPVPHSRRSGRRRLSSGWWRAIALVVVAALAALAVTASYNQSGTQRAMSKQLDARVAEAATLASGFVGTVIQLIGVNLEFDAAQPVLTHMVATRQADRAAMTTYLQGLRLGVVAINTLAVLDRTGRVVATTDRQQLVGTDQSTRDYFQGAARTGKTYLSTAYLSSGTSNGVMANMTTPIRQDSSKTITGYLTATVPMDQLQIAVVQFARQSGLGITVTDQHGATIASSQPQAFGKLNQENRAWVTPGLAGKLGTVTVQTLQGRARLSYTTISGNWLIAVWLPEWTVLNPLHRLRNSTLMLTGALALAVLICGVLLIYVNRGRERAMNRLREEDERRHFAREVNDRIVQDLVAAEAYHDLGDTEHSRNLLRSASRHARQWVGQLLVEDGPVRPGAARIRHDRDDAGSDDPDRPMS